MSFQDRAPGPGERGAPESTTASRDQDGHYDVAVCDGWIAAVEKTILPSSAAAVIDVAGKLVLPGLSDTRAHVCQYVTGRFGLNLNLDMACMAAGDSTILP